MSREFRMEAAYPKLRILGWYGGISENGFGVWGYGADYVKLRVRVEKAELRI